MNDIKEAGEMRKNGLYFSITGEDCEWKLESDSISLGAEKFLVVVNHTGSKKFLNSSTMEIIEEPLFEKCQDVGDFFVIHNFEKQKKFFRKEDMKVSDVFESWGDFGNGFFLLSDSSEKNRLFRASDMKVSDVFESWQDLGNGFFLLSSNGYYRFLCISDMKESASLCGYKYWEDLGNGFFIIFSNPNKKGPTNLLRTLDMQVALKPNTGMRCIFDFESWEDLGGGVFLIHEEFIDRFFYSDFSDSERSLSEEFNQIITFPLDGELSIYTSRLFMGFVRNSDKKMSPPIKPFEVEKDLGNGRFLLKKKEESPKDREKRILFNKKNMGLSFEFKDYKDINNDFVRIESYPGHGGLGENFIMRWSDMKCSGPYHPDFSSIERMGEILLLRDEDGNEVLLNAFNLKTIRSYHIEDTFGELSLVYLWADRVYGVQNTRTLEVICFGEDLKKWEKLSNGLFILSSRDGSQKAFFNASDMKISESVSFETYSVINSELVLLADSSGNKRMFNKESMLFSGYFNSWKDLGNGFFLFEDKKGNNRFSRMNNMNLSAFFKSWQDLGNGFFLLSDSRGNNRFFRTSDMQVSTFFKSWEDLGNGFFLLSDSSVNNRFFRTSDMQVSKIFGSYKNLPENKILLEQKNGKKFCSLPEMKYSSTWRL